MSNNLNTIIEKIKESAVGRCRERIEMAADKAREVLNTKKKEEMKVPLQKSEVQSMTSFMKRQHGL